jgi:hypothetical protein
MNAIRPQSSKYAGPHLSEAELFDMQQGRSSPTQFASGQQHLFVCPKCLQAFKEVSDFLTPPQAEELAVSNEQVEAGWQELKERLPRSKPGAQAAPTAALVTTASTSRGWLLPLAAGLLVTLGLAGLFVWRGRQPETQIARVSDAPSQPPTQVSPVASVRPTETQPEQQGVGRQAMPSAAQAHRPSQTAQPPFQVSELLVTSGEKAASDTAPAQILFVPAQEKTFSLRLRIYNPLDYSSFRVELLDQKRTPVQAVGGRLTKDLAIEALFERAGLADGKYFLRVTGYQGQIGSTEPLESAIEITARRN